MGTEEDRTNNGVVITLFVVGSAAMLGGSAAIVGMTRTEMEQQSEHYSAFADLESVRELKEQQRRLLREAQLPIDKAGAQLLADIQRDPYQASWATPSGAATMASGGASGEAVEAAAGAGGASAAGGSGAQEAGDAAAEGGEGNKPQAPPDVSATAQAPTESSAPQAPPGLAPTPSE